ncbi:MAG: DUF6268 family outer membrane beta-barrel protein [Bacteroidota bacterium]
MIKLKVGFTIVVMLAIGFSHAQKYTDLFSVSEQYSPNNLFKSGNAKCTIQDQNLAAKAPIKINATDFVLVGFSANRLTFSGDSLPGGSSFLATTLQVGYIANFGRYNITAVALPKVSSDFAEVTHHSFQMGGLLIFSVKYSDNFKLKYGCYYNQEFFGPLIVPIIGLDWKVNENLRIFGNLPITATAEYTLSKRFSTGIFFNANTCSYLYDKQKQYIHKSTQEISAFGDFYLTKNIVFQTKLGFTLGRKYDLFNLSDKIDAKLFAEIGDNRTQLNSNTLKDGFIGEFKLIFRVPTP